MQVYIYGDGPAATSRAGEGDTDMQNPERGARISADGQYRYLLWRSWVGEAAPSAVTFVMLNPSTADGETDDPTIRRCIGFAQRWGHDTVNVVNLFAFRATDPAELVKPKDPYGPENDQFVLDTCLAADRVVCAWGESGGDIGRRRAARVEIMLTHAGIDLYAIALTKKGVPKHPLYLKGDLDPVLWKKGVEP